MMRHLAALSNGCVSIIRPRLINVLAGSLVVAWIMSCIAPSHAVAGEVIDYNRDIRPILSDNCYQCHGPDAAERQAGLRLDVQEAATAELESGERAIVPGDVDASELVQRITSDDESMRMPPPETGKSLSDEQIEKLKKWIEAGAPWRGHWAFERPRRPELPEVEHEHWPRNPIDYFVLRRLEDNGLVPMPEADRAKLIRRVTLDLTGLPPTLEEIDAFLLDNSPDAYEKVVDRLLASSRYGEHMARYWLDAARYGDTHGLHLDNYRSIWPYRDWVIRAFNRNMPFDQFTVEQLAGDLLPNPTRDQLVATGFNRCNVTTSEGGSIPEEFRVRYAVDRVSTLATVWLGLTAGCAVCHDHKFDPLTQREFYELFAFYNSMSDKAMDGNAPDPAPVAKVPTPEQEQRLRVLSEQIASLRKKLNGPWPEVDAAQARWQEKWSRRLANRWQVLDPIDFSSQHGTSLRKLEDYSLLAEGENPPKEVYDITAATSLTGIVAIRLEALTHESLPHTGPGRGSNANFVLSEIEAEVVSIADPSRSKVVKFIAATADLSQEEGGSFPVEKAIDGLVDDTNGWAVAGYKHRENRTAVFVPSEPIGFEGGTTIRFRLRFETHFAQHAIGRVRLAVSTDADFVPITQGPWHSVGPFTAEDGRKAYATPYGPEKMPVDLSQSYGDAQLQWQLRDNLEDGKVHTLEGERAATYLYRTIYSPSTRQMVLSLGSDDALKVWLNGDVVLDRYVERGVAPNQDRITVTLRPGENQLLMKVVNQTGGYGFYYRAKPDDQTAALAEVETILAVPEDQRTVEQKKKLRDVFRRHASPEWKAIEQQLAKVEAEKKSVDAQVPTSMISRDLPKPRETFVLKRGQYDLPDKDQKVEPGVPSIFPPLPDDAPRNRLGLAKWLVDPQHPLTARVTVNRFWQQLFGTGIVKTAEDFGSQGEWPTHPKLLDWLAVEFVESGWDVKHMLRLMVTSATYRQSSSITPARLRIDPQNRLLSRGPRFRMDAEMVRDTALAVSGLLVEKLGGPSVKPYQPPGLWKAVGYTTSNTANFVKDTGDKLYRRSLYTFWKRTSPPPSLKTFDAPTRESCTVRRPRTNTPLQALVLMNDTQFVEAARHLAERIMRHEGPLEEKLSYGFRLVTGRPPTVKEVEVLQASHESLLKDFQQRPDAAKELLAVGDSPRDESLDAIEHAAWTMVANLLLNLDETITKD